MRNAEGEDQMLMTRRHARMVALLLATLPLTGCSYNRFVTQEEAIKAQWAQVQNQLQRRNDLIPISSRTSWKR
jgi:LemA protein